MLRPRIAVPVVLVVAAVAAAGVAAATRHTQSTQAAAADFAAGTVSRSHTTDVRRERWHLPAHDGDVHRDCNEQRSPVERTARDPVVQRREHDNEARLARRDAAIRGTNAGASGRIHAAIANGAAVGSLVGKGTRPEAKLVASLSGAFTPATGFAAGSKIGSGSANGAGVLYTRGDCRKRSRVRRPRCSICA